MQQVNSTTSIVSKPKMEIPDLRWLYGHVVVWERVKIIDHASWGLVQYNFANDAQGVFRAYGVALQAEVRVQKQSMVRHRIYVCFACDRCRCIPRY